MKTFILVLAVSALAHGHDEEPASYKRSYELKYHWNGEPIEDQAYVKFTLDKSESNCGVEINVEAPYYNDTTPPDNVPGQPFKGLWYYEVAEAYFLSRNGGNDHYFQIQLSPHGSYYSILLDGYRNGIAWALPIEYEAKIDEENMTWSGKAVIPKAYFPPNVNHFSAAYMHGGEISGVGESKKERMHYTLYPMPGDEPDFHKLEYFRPFCGEFINDLVSMPWKEAFEGKWTDQLEEQTTTLKSDEVY